MRDRVGELQRRLADARGRRIVLLSHCLLNENVRYLGGAGRAGGVQEVMDDYVDRGIGIYQLPCPEQHAWGGVLKRRLLFAYGAGRSWRGPVARLLLRPFVAYTRLVYIRLARSVAHDVLDYRDAGVTVVGLVGIGGSPSCGARTTLDLPVALDTLASCPFAQLDVRFLNEDVVAANVRPGQGMFVCALQHRLAAAGVNLPVSDHDLLGEIEPAPATVATIPN